MEGLGEGGAHESGALVSHYGPGSGRLFERG